MTVTTKYGESFPHSEGKNSPNFIECPPISSFFMSYDISQYLKCCYVLRWTSGE